MTPEVIDEINSFKQFISHSKSTRENPFIRKSHDDAKEHNMFNLNSIDTSRSFKGDTDLRKNEQTPTLYAIPTESETERVSIY